MLNYRPSIFLKSQQWPTAMAGCLNSSLITCPKGCILSCYEMEKIFVWPFAEAFFGHLLFSHLVLTRKSVRWRELNKGRLVCSFQSRIKTCVKMAGSWQIKILCCAPFVPFYSVLCLCVIPGDVNWHVSPSWQKLGMKVNITEDGDSILLRINVMISHFVWPGS